MGMDQHRAQISAEWIDTITGEVSGALLPSLGLSKADYQWNLWPRDGSVSGNNRHI